MSDINVKGLKEHTIVVLYRPFAVLIIFALLSLPATAVAKNSNCTCTKPRYRSLDL
jgi:hypothetical protein